ncbi:MAG: TGS domain-containing protein, partial [Nanoarchaeota archaeon]
KVPCLEVNTLHTNTKIKDEVWKRLNLIKVYTKQPHREKDFPPIALPKGATVKDLASRIHKDFLRKFKFARIYGPSVKFQGQQVGISHRLEDGDVVELNIEK